MRHVTPTETSHSSTNVAGLLYGKLTAIDTQNETQIEQETPFWIHSLFDLATTLRRNFPNKPNGP